MAEFFAIVESKQSRRLGHREVCFLWVLPLLWFCGAGVRWNVCGRGEVEMGHRLVPNKSPGAVSAAAVVLLTY